MKTAKAFLLVDINRYQHVAAEAGVIADFVKLQKEMLKDYVDVNILFVLNHVPSKYQEKSPPWFAFRKYVQSNNLPLYDTEVDVTDKWDRNLVATTHIMNTISRKGYTVFHFDPDPVYNTLRKLGTDSLFVQCVAPQVTYQNADIDLVNFLDRYDSLKRLTEVNKGFYQQLQGMNFETEQGEILKGPRKSK